MKTNIQLFTLLLLFFGVLAGCKDDENTPEPLPTPQNKLEASAGADRQVKVNEEVNLDGTDSKDGAGKPFSYLWNFKTKPEASNPLLANSTTATPSFTPDVAGIYVIELKITQGSFFDVDEVKITVTAETNELPSAGVISEDIENDTTLLDIFSDPTTPDYYVTSSIGVKAKLNLAPGVVLAFEEDQGLHIFPQGSFVAKGENQNPIIFRGKEPLKGYWKGILLDSNSPLNEIDHVVIEQGGSSSFSELPGIKANLALTGSLISGASIRITNSFLQEGAGFGLYLQDKAQLLGFSNNAFFHNLGSALYLPAQEVYKVDESSRFTGSNGFEGVETGGVIHHEAPLTWPTLADGSAYLLSSNLIIKSGLSITEGAVVKMGAGVIISVEEEGYFSSNGSPEAFITFTAHSQTPEGHWVGILFHTNHPLNKLQYCEISYAGAVDMPGFTATKGNVGVRAGGNVLIQNSSIKHGLGWGVVLEQGAVINTDILTVNTFENLVLGSVFPSPIDEPQHTTLEGDWVDSWSYSNEDFTVDEELYNPTTGIWFREANNPWVMVPQAGFGLKIREDGSYTWAIAENHPYNPECFSYSAEYLQGQISLTGDYQLLFRESYWRTRYYNSCENDNVDQNIEPGSMSLRHEITLETLPSGEQRWALKLINPDNSFFTYYRKKELAE